MAIPAIKTTYSLDVDTVRTLERIARRWGVSKSEALRRAIRRAATPERDDRLSALEELQRSVGLDPARADAWVRSVRAERRASGPRRIPRRRG